MSKQVINVHLDAEARKYLKGLAKRLSKERHSRVYATDLIREGIAMVRMKYGEK